MCAHSVRAGGKTHRFFLSPTVGCQVAEEAGGEGEEEGKVQIFESCCLHIVRNPCVSVCVTIWRGRTRTA